MNKIRLVQGSFSCQNVYGQHRSVNTTPCPKPHGSSVTQSVFSLKFAGKVSSVKYSFLTVSTEQNLTFRKKQITEINNSMQKAGATIVPNTATAVEPFHLNQVSYYKAPYESIFDDETHLTYIGYSASSLPNTREIVH